MKKNLHLFLKTSAGIVPLLFALLAGLSTVTLAQGPDVIVPAMLEDPRAAERESDPLKSADATEASAYATSWNGSYSSDYYIYFKYSGLSFGCDCSSSKYQVSLYINSAWRNVGTISGTAYSGLGLKYGVGCGKDHHQVCDPA